MDAAGGTRPEAGAEAEVIPIDRRVPLRTRVEQGDTGTLVVRPAPRDLDGRDVVRDGDHVRVLWRDIHSGWELPAQVSAVERGTVLRWHLAVLGPAERIQRREAVRARLAVPVTAVLNSVDLEGEVVDLSEGGVRAVLEAYGNPPPPGTVVPLTVHLEDGEVTTRAEIVLHQTRGIRWVVSLRFLDLPEKEQDRLRRRVFQALRAERARMAGAD